MKYKQLGTSILGSLCLLTYPCLPGLADTTPANLTPAATPAAKTTGAASPTASVVPLQGKAKEAGEKQPETPIAVTSPALTVNVPNTPDAWLKQGLEHSKVENYEQSVEDFTNVIRLDPHMAIAYAQRGFSYLKLNKLDLSLKDCNKALSIDPNLIAAYNCRGNVYIQMEKYDLALKDFDTALSLNPNDFTSRLNHASGLYYSKQYTKMIAECTAAIKANPTNPIPYDNRGLAYHELKKYQLAINDYNKALSLRPHNARYICHRGISYAEMGQHQRAIQDFDEALKLEPQYPLAYFDRGISHFLLHEYDKATSDFENAIRLDHRFAMALEELPLDPTKGAKPVQPMTDPSQFYYRATSRVLMAKNAQAIVDLKHYLSATNWQGPLSGSAVILAYLGYRHSNQNSEAMSMLSDATTHLNQNDWPYLIIRYFLKQLSASDLLAKTTNNDQLTDAHAYTGIDLLWNGHKQEALSNHINWVIARGNGMLISYSLAVKERERLQMRKSLDTEKESIFSHPW